MTESKHPTLWAYFENGALVHADPVLTELCCPPAEAVRYEAVTEPVTIDPQGDIADRAKLEVIAFIEERMAGYFMRNPEAAWTQVIPATLRDLRAGLEFRLQIRSRPAPEWTDAEILRVVTPEWIAAMRLALHANPKVLAGLDELERSLQSRGKA